MAPGALGVGMIGRFEHAPEFALEIPHVFILPVTQSDFYRPHPFFFEGDIGLEDMVAFVNIVWIVGAEFASVDFYSIGTLDGDRTLVLTSFIRRAKTNYPGATGVEGQLFDHEYVKDSLEVEHTVIASFRVLAEQYVAAMQVLHDNPRSCPYQAVSQRNSKPFTGSMGVFYEL